MPREVGFRFRFRIIRCDIYEKALRRKVLSGVVTFLACQCRLNLRALHFAVSPETTMNLEKMKRLVISSITNAVCMFYVHELTLPRVLKTENILQYVDSTTGDNVTRHDVLSSFKHHQ